MATQLQLRKGNTAQTAVFTGALAEVTVDTDQKTVVVHDGTTVGGTYIITKAQLDSNVSILQGVNTTQNTNITSVNGFAAGAFNTANGANGLAAGAFNLANTNSGLITIIQGVDLTQNTNITAVNNFAASAYNQANTNATNITAVNNFAASAYNTANGANGLAAGAYNQANSAYSYATIVQSIADAAYLKANAAFDSSNAVNGYAVSAFNTANGANGLAAGAYNAANTNAGAITIIQGVDLTQNAAITVIQGVDVAQNTRMSIIEGVDLTQNTNITAVNNFAQSAYDKANSANVLAQAAYDTANTKFSSSGGNINGPVTITANSDLTVTGNLVVLGNTFSVGTQTLEVVDPMIILAIGNYSTDTLDIGFAGHYNNGSNAHTGLFRDADSKDWYLFQGYTPDLSGNNEINIADASFDTANLIAKRVTANVVATTVTIGGRDQASVDSTQNTNITAVNNYAASGYALANTNATNISIIQGVDVTQNTRLNSIETVNLDQNTAITIIQGVDLTQNTNITAVNNFTQSAFDTANTANTRAFNTVLKSGDTMTGALVVPTVDFNNGLITSNTFVTSSNTQVSVDEWPWASYNSAKYFVQVSSGFDRHIIELSLVHNRPLGTQVFLAQYGEVTTGTSLGTFDVDISGSSIRLLFTGTNAVSTIKLLRTVMNS